MHGGLIMSLTDTLGSLAVASRGQYMTGVSTDISTSFVKPAGKPGDELKITATLTVMGAFTFTGTVPPTPFLVRALPLLPSLSRLTHGACLVNSFLKQGSRWRTPRSILMIQRDSWSPTGVGLRLVLSYIAAPANRGLGPAHTKYIGKSTGHVVSHLLCL